MEKKRARTKSQKIAYWIVLIVLGDFFIPKAIFAFTTTAVYLPRLPTYR